MNKNMVEKCPFREGSISRKIYLALAKCNKPLDVKDIAARAKVPEAKTRSLVASYQNFYHTAPLRACGIKVAKTKDGLYKLQSCKADPKAKRPPRGKKVKPKKNPGKSNKKIDARKNKRAKPAGTAQLQTKNDNPVVVAQPPVSEARNVLNERERTVLLALNETPKHVDAIVAESKLKAEEVLATLLVLEVRRLIRQHPGKLFSKSEAK